MNADPLRMSARDFRKMQGLPVDGEVSKSAGKPAPGIRMPKERKKSKPEVLYGQILEIEFRPHYGSQVLYEPFSFRLPSGTRYSPDWVVMSGDQIKLCVEVKGNFRLGSAGASHEKFKAACKAFPAIRFRYAKFGKDGWAVTNVN